MIDSKYGELRKVQFDCLGIAQDWVAGTRTDRTARIFATPGAGKTLSIAIMAHELLDAHLIKGGLIVEPRDALRTQIRNGFTDQSRGLFRGVVSDMRKYRDGQLSLLAKSGLVTTYQAIAKPENFSFFQRLLSCGQMALVLDEAHHLCEAPVDPKNDSGGKWWRSIRPLWEAAKYRIALTGSPDRNHGERVPVFLYGDSDRLPIFDASYSRRDALREKAILPVMFKRLDGNATYEFKGRIHQVDLSTTKRESRRQALRALLSAPGYRDKVTIRCLREFIDYRRDHYMSRAIVICDKQSTAVHLGKLIEKTLGLRVAVAISDEGEDGKRALRMFRDYESYDVLVTVAMAHEGLDVPAVSHLICLTNVRSEPWIVQAFGRATRMNYRAGLPWERQQAFIYVPDDEDMRVIIDRLMSEQLSAWKDPKERKEGAGQAPRHDSVITIDGEPRVTRYSTEDGNLDDSDSHLVGLLGQYESSLSHLPIPVQLKIARAMRPELLGG